MFPKATHVASGLQSWCKACKSAASVQYQRTDKVKARRAVADKKKRASDPEHRKYHLEKTREHMKKPGVLERLLESRKLVAAANPEHAKAKSRQYYETRKSDPSFILSSRVKAGIRKFINSGIEKSSPTFVLLGYTPEDLRIHMEAQFLEGMSWQNFGDWHIDHIIPLAVLKPKDEAGLASAWCLSNLRPLWAKENMQKRDKVLFLL